MRKKQSWMFIGAIVLLPNGKIGTITAMQENKLNGIDYVYNISIKLPDKKFSLPYHPGDLQELIVKQEVAP